MTESSMTAVEAKWNEAHTLLSRLETESKRDEFYATLNAFLAAARSVLYVLQYQFGWKELRDNQKIALDPPETVLEDRKRFDAWFRRSATVREVLAHPLKEERDVVIHRSGQPEGFKYLPKPLDSTYWVQRYGLPKGAGDALNPVRMSGGRSLWPPRDDNLFFYVQSDGSEVSATEYCGTYLQLIDSLMQEARPMPWLG